MDIPISRPPEGIFRQANGGVAAPKNRRASGAHATHPQVLPEDPILKDLPNLKIFPGFSLCLPRGASITEDDCLAPQISQVGNAAVIEREAVTLPLDHALGFESAALMA